MDILNSLYTSVFGMVVVFAVLVFLIFLIYLQTVLIKKFSNRKATAELSIAVSSAPQPESAPASKEVHFTSSAAQFVDLVDVDETTAAVIMAIICDQIGAQPEELYFNSIRLLTDPVPVKN